MATPILVCIKEHPENNDDLTPHRCASAFTQTTSLQVQKLANSTRLWHEEEKERQSLKLSLKQPCILSVRDFIFLASAYEGRVANPLHRRVIFPLTVCCQCAHHSRVGYTGAGRAEISNQIHALG